MALRFRKSFKLGRGARLNLGKSSASVRLGGKNAGYTLGTGGRTLSASIPGTGLGIVSRAGSGSRRGGGSSLLAKLLTVAVCTAAVLWVASFFPKANPPSDAGQLAQGVDAVDQ